MLHIHWSIITYPITCIIAFLIYLTVYVDKGIVDIDAFTRSGIIQGLFLVSTIGLLSLALHEVAHIGMAQLFGYHPTEIRAGWYGAAVYFEKPLYQDIPAIIIARLAGPIASIIIALILLIPLKFVNDPSIRSVLQFSAYLNYISGLFGLLPIFIVSDGGWALRDLLTLSMDRAYALLVVLLMTILIVVLQTTNTVNFFYDPFMKQ